MLELIDNHSSEKANSGFFYSSEEEYYAIKEQLDNYDISKRKNLYNEENKGKKSLLFKVGILYFIALSLVVCIRILNNLNVFDGLDFITKNIVQSTLIQIVIMFGVAFLGYSLIRKQKLKSTFKDFKFKKISGKVILLSIVAGLAVYFLNGYLVSLFSYIISIIGYEGIPGDNTVNASNYTLFYFMVSVVCSCLLPAVCEETLHRGLLLNVIKRYGVGKAIIITGLLFGLMHLNINQFFFATCIGWILGVLTIVSGSIYPAIIVHFINNFLSTCGEFAYANSIDYLSLSSLINYVEGLLGKIFGNMVFFAVILLLAILLLYVIYKIYCITKFKQILTDVKNQNCAYFYHKNNVDETGKIKHNSLVNFFGTENIKLGLIAYLSNNNSQKRFWDNFDDTYLNEDRKNAMSWAFIVGSFVLSSVATIFTLVWGVL